MVFVWYSYQKLTLHICHMHVFPIAVRNKGGTEWVKWMVREPIVLQPIS